MIKTKSILIIIFALICVAVGLLSPYIFAGVNEQDIKNSQVDITSSEYDNIDIGEIYPYKLSYVGSWTYTQVGEGDTGLSNGDIFNMTINEDLTVSMTLYNVINGQTDEVDLSQSEVTELENGLKLSFQEDEVHLLTLVDENTLHVSLYDDGIKFDATRVIE